MAPEFEEATATRSWRRRRATRSWRRRRATGDEDGNRWQGTREMRAANGGILKEKRDRRRFMRRVYLLAQQAEIQTKKHKAEEMQEVAVQENFRRDGCSLSFFFLEELVG